MDTIRQLIQIEGVTYTDPETNSSDAWRAFQELRNKCPTEAQRQDERLVEVYKTNLALPRASGRTRRTTRSARSCKAPTPSSG